MVKNLISAALALIMVFGLCFLEGTTQKRSFHKMHAALTVVYEKALNGQATKDDGESLNTLWQKQKEKLHVFIPHTDIRELDLWLSEAIFYLGAQDYEEACGKIEVLIHVCETLPKTYDFSLENFL